MDGASKGNPNKVGGSGIYRDKEGKIICTFAKYYSIQNNHKAELEVMLRAVDLVFREGCSRVIVEGDSMNVVNLIKGEVEPNWKHQAMINDVKLVLQSRDNAQVSHTYREGNKVVDRLANWGVQSKRFDV